LGVAGFAVSPTIFNKWGLGVERCRFARIGGALGTNAEDAFTQNRRLWVRLREEGSRAHAMPPTEPRVDVWFAKYNRHELQHSLHRRHTA
jgi:hypothetical protein